MKYALLVLAIVAIVMFAIALSLSSCTYQIVQQQNGNRRSAQFAAVGSGEPATVTAYQGDPASRPADPPLSTYPEYNGYPGSGYRPSASTFFPRLFEGAVQLNIGPGYGYGASYDGYYHGPYGPGYAGPRRLLYPYYH